MSTTRRERERAVLDLYHNQGKTVRDIAKVARMSFRDIGASTTATITLVTAIADTIFVEFIVTCNHHKVL